MIPQPHTEPEHGEVDALDERLTPLERAIEKADIDVAACISALGGLCLKAAIGVALVVGAMSGDLVGLRDLIEAALNSHVG